MHPHSAPQSPIERFARIVNFLVQAVAAQTGWGLSLRMIELAATRLGTIRQRFERLAARIVAGTYVPPEPRAPRPRNAEADPGAELPPPRPAGTSPLPTEFGWMLKLNLLRIPTAAAASQLSVLTAQPDMAALLAAAPGPMGRVLRPLYWALGYRPPDILRAPPRRRGRRKLPPQPRKLSRRARYAMLMESEAALDAKRAEMMKDAPAWMRGPRPKPTRWQGFMRSRFFAGD